jgi:hypothetical protein
MAQVSRYELEIAEGFDLCAAMISPVLPLKAHGVAVAGDEAGVADGSFGDVGTEVFDRTLTISKGLKMHAPLLGPEHGMANCLMGR